MSGIFHTSWEKGIYIGAVAARLLLLLVIVLSAGQETLYTFPGALSGQYIVWGESILSGQGFFEPAYNYFESKRTPGYSVFLLPFLALDIPLWAASVLQIVLFSLMPVLAMRFARRLGFGSKTERLAGLFTAFEPLQIFYSVLIMPDSLSALFFFMGVYFLASFWLEEKNSRLALGSVFFAFSNYLRPTTVVWFFLVPLLWMFLWRKFKGDWYRGIRAGFIFGAIFLILLLPWMLRNYYHFGVLGFSSGLGPYVLIYSGSGIMAAAKHITFEKAQEQIESEVIPYLPYPADFYSIKNSAALTQKAKEIVLQYPGTFVKMYFFAAQTFFISGNYHVILKYFGLLDPPSQGQVSITRLFASDGISAVWQRIKVFVIEPYGAVALLGRMFLGIIFLASLYGAYRSWRRGPPSGFAAALYLFALFYGALSVVAGVEGMEARHRLFLNPLIFIFSSIGLVGIGTYFRSFTALFSEKRT